MAEIRNFQIIAVLVNLIRESKIVKLNAMKGYWGGVGYMYLYSFLTSTSDDSGGTIHVHATNP
jgi:hypothetical protein